MSPLRLDQFHVNRAAAPLLARLKRMGFLLIGTTNQPAVARGEVTRDELRLMHDLLHRELMVDDVMICPHDDETHPCHKPQPGMFLEAAFRWRLDMEWSFVISNKWEDAKAAQALGCTSVMIESPWLGDDPHDFVVPDFPAAIAKIEYLATTLRRKRRAV